jgi:hypothetical protein
MRTVGAFVNINITIFTVPTFSARCTLSIGAGAVLAAWGAIG